MLIVLTTVVLIVLITNISLLLVVVILIVGLCFLLESTLRLIEDHIIIGNELWSYFWILVYKLIGWGSVHEWL
jgi:hypothetical protein